MNQRSHHHNNNEDTTELLEQGIIKLEGTDEKAYCIRLLNTSDVTALLDLQEEILSNLEIAELSVPFTKEELLFILSGHGECVGFLVDNQLLAACALQFDLEDFNMSKEVGFDKKQQQQVEQLEMSLVHERTRGHKLQRRLAGILVERAIKRGNKRYLFSTVSPWNYPSVQTVTSLGLNIVKVTKMYNDWTRYVVCRDMHEPTILNMSTVRKVAIEDFEVQSMLLEQSYLGFSQERTPEGVRILFAQPITKPKE
ncbi:hypothetical protein [Desulfuribacillus alkaliarsenatis]|uniref:N-acetyltransferase domain-containing protein n=1 Tax=Desulfuribacillus alkaliarsenatis TaxID=766136 RepID=A0A1E5G2D2_9FIRM|nr:hypothetical protein [Desulfuribacillus alkaliarsenatis]OEF97131.1 hypothetical protein BHF68_05920 [Desulfuribacillus alkaliarsenatis]